MKRSGVKAKYSPTQLNEVAYVEFVSFSQDILVSYLAKFRKVGRQPKSINPFCMKAQSPQKKVLQRDIEGPNDLKLGVSTQDQKCQTCGETKQCQGHFGYIRLAETVYHYGFLKYIEKILKCVCHKCCHVKRPTVDF